MSIRRDPLAYEHYCGEFPGAGGFMLVNKIAIYQITKGQHGIDARPGWYWWNAKEGNGRNKGGPFAHSWQAFENALHYYPKMREGELYETYLALRPPPVYAPRRPRVRAIR